MRVFKFKVGDIVKVRNITNEIDARYFSVGDVGRITETFSGETTYPYHVEFNGYGNKKTYMTGLWYVQEKDLVLASCETNEESVVERIKTIDNRSDEEKSLADSILG